MQAHILLYEVIGIVAAYASTIPITSYNDILCALVGQIKDLIRVLSTCTVQLRGFWIPCCAHANKILQKLHTTISVEQACSKETEHEFALQVYDGHFSGAVGGECHFLTS
jgi:hypothetical protein